MSQPTVQRQATLDAKQDDSRFQAPVESPSGDPDVGNRQIAPTFPTHRTMNLVRWWFNAVTLKSSSVTQQW